MVIFIGNCSRYLTSQMNILATMKAKAIFVATHLKRAHYDIITTTKR